MDCKKDKGSHGQILERIYAELVSLAKGVDVFVRERGFSRFSKGTQTLFKVVGISDLAVWQVCEKQFEEIPPTIVKKTITGKGSATKEEVAAGLARFVGKREYASDDQSDAVAVGVTWLNRNGCTSQKVLLTGGSICQSRK